MAWVIGYSFNLVIDYAVGWALSIDGITRTILTTPIASMGCERLMTKKKKFRFDVVEDARLTAWPNDL